MLDRHYSVTNIQNLLCFLKSVTFLLLSVSYFQSVTSIYSLLNYSYALLSEVGSCLKEGIPELIKKNKKLKQIIFKKSNQITDEDFTHPFLLLWSCIVYNDWIFLSLLSNCFIALDCIFRGLPLKQFQGYDSGYFSYVSSFYPPSTNVMTNKKP